MAAKWLLVLHTPALACLAPAAQAADIVGPGTRLGEVVVQGKPFSPSIVRFDAKAPGTTPAADLGALLRQVPGVSASRMGGHGLDPVIRGQQQTQLNVIGDGAFQHGGCPNRMDPPSSLSAFDAYDTITVEKGYQSVTHGPGGSGGSVILDRKRPQVSRDKPYQVEAGGGYDSNGEIKNGYFDAGGGVEEGYVRALGSHRHANDYEDGNGSKVRSGYDTWSGTVELGWTGKDNSYLAVSHERDRTQDAMFAGAGMDAPDTVNHVSRVKGSLPIDNDILRRVEASAYLSQVSHVMDNYSLRSYGAMTMRTDSNSDTSGGKMSADLWLWHSPVVVGVDLQNNNRDATRYRGTTPANTATPHSFMWPDLTLRQIGVFGEGTATLTETDRMKLGARYDSVYADAAAANKVTSTSATIRRSANELYQLYYGKRMETTWENNLGGLVRYEHDFAPGLMAHAVGSRSVRTADATERGMAGDNATASSRWIGNPDIAPEKHHQFEGGLSWEQKTWEVGGAAYHDWVSDYIFRDTARGQAGILQSDRATIYRNVDATLWGVEVNGQVLLFDGVRIQGNIAYTEGTNQDTSLPLPQIAPLSAGLDLAYEGDGWTVGTRLNAALRQNRTDASNETGSGRDVRKTAGYLVPDLYAAIDAFEPFEIKLGITNLLDHTYANHLNRSNSFDLQEVQVNEPGRSFYVQVNAEF